METLGCENDNVRVPPDGGRLIPTPRLWHGPYPSLTRNYIKCLASVLLRNINRGKSVWVSSLSLFDPIHKHHGSTGCLEVQDRVGEGEGGREVGAG